MYFSNFIGKTKKLILNPTKFFEDIKREKGFLEVFKYCLIISLLPSVFLALLYQSLGLFDSLMTPKTNWLLLYFIIVLSLFIFFIIVSFVSSILIHITAIILRGKGNFLSSYKCIVYGTAPSYLFGWIPLIGLVFNFYSIYVTIIGIIKLHKVSAIRAIFILVLPAIIILLLLLLLINPSLLLFI